MAKKVPANRGRYRVKATQLVLVIVVIVLVISIGKTQLISMDFLTCTCVPATFKGSSATDHCMWYNSIFEK